MLAIFKKEMRQYFITPVGYVYIAVYLAVSGFAFSMFTVQTASSGSDAQVNVYFTVLMFIFSVLVPLLTMRIFADERKMRTEELLMTAPVSINSMVAAKFLAAYSMFAATFLISLFDYYVLFKYGKPQPGVLFGYAVGILLLGGAFVAIGVFVSSLTENQITAAVGTMAILLLMLSVNFFNSYIDITWIRTVLNWISIYSRFGNFTYGVFDFTALLYYASIMFVFLFLTVRVYERRRWE
ncbi:MAG: ABC transporter permease [Clostridiales bacterium]|nr:ABC transporter permease [Clostridiales bacterium]